MHQYILFVPLSCLVKRSHKKLINQKDSYYFIVTNISIILTFHDIFALIERIVGLTLAVKYLYLLILLSLNLIFFYTNFLLGLQQLNPKILALNNTNHQP